MNDWTERIYLYEVKLQCQLAIMAATDVETSLNELMNPPSAEAGMAPDFFEKRESSSLRFWSSLQAFLAATGNISKMLWPDKSGDKLRGDKLREILAVPEDSPLKPRASRNAFEHIDERLDRWERTSTTHNLSHRNIGDRGMISGNFSVNDHVAFFDTSTREVIFLGESSGDIAEQVHAANELLRKTIAILLAPLPRAFPPTTADESPSNS